MILYLSLVGTKGISPFRKINLLMNSILIFMVRVFIILVISSVLISCSQKGSKNTVNKQASVNEPVIDLSTIAQMKVATADGYRKVLGKLDQGDLESIHSAILLFKNCETDSLSRDSMFVAFNDFFTNLASGYLESNEKINAQLNNSRSKDTIEQVRKLFASYGIGLASSEGEYYLEPKYEYFLANFGSGLSQAYREYLAIDLQEQKVQFSDDAAILIPLDSLASRILIRESFLEKYPTFISAKMAQDQYAQYLGAYLAGMDNSRVFNLVTNRLNEEPKKSFEAFVANHPGRKSSEVVKDYLDLLRSTNYNYTDKVDSFLLSKVYQE